VKKRAITGAVLGPNWLRTKSVAFGSKTVAPDAPEITTMMAEGKVFGMLRRPFIEIPQENSPFLVGR